MGASQIHDRRRAARRQLIDQVRVNHASEIDVGELRLERERTLLEPQIQRLIEGERRLRPLRSVHVDVDEAGKTVAVLPQLDERALRAVRLKRRRLIAIVVFQHARDDARVIHLDERVLEVLERSIHRRMEEGTVESLLNRTSHDRRTFLLYYSTTPRTGSMT